jgi:hypothetical protein
MATAKYVWVQMLPDKEVLITSESVTRVSGGRLVRAIVTEGNKCPNMLVNGKAHTMNRRDARVTRSFPILLCEFALDDTSEAKIGLQALPERASNPNDVVVIGDTGCRMVHWQTQPCRTASGWPFESIAARAAVTIASQQRPSIIVHVGDFHYRENPCLDADPNCGGSPFGDNWATWEQEFFKPAASLLLSAPWVIVRGNHEDCARAGAGWLFFFALPDQQKTAKACEDDIEAYQLSIGRTASGRPRILTVLDTSHDSQIYDIKDRCSKYRKWVEKLGQIDAEYWLALHQPLWLRGDESKDNSKEDAAASNAECIDMQTKSGLFTIRARFLDAKERRRLARLVLSGDTHVFRYFQPTDKFKFMPIQIVAGNSGTMLDKFMSGTGDATSYGIDGSAVTVATHGFTTLHVDEAVWTVKSLDSAGKTVASCRFSEKVEDLSPLDCPQRPN